MGIVFGVFGGLGLFIYGIKLIGINLQKVFEKQLEKLMENSNKYNIIMSTLFGTIITIIMQSSSITTVVAVGFVNSGIMTLMQAFGIVMGANVGTTLTTQIIAFDLITYVPIFITVAIIILLFMSNTKSKDIANILIGFSILFISMRIMREAISQLNEFNYIYQVVSDIRSPLLGIIIGFGISTIIQSSSASTALLIVIAKEGFITIDVAFPILLGQNIGTCVTALFSSEGTSKAGKRAGFIHIFFNIIGAIVFALLLRQPLQNFVIFLSPQNVSRQIANAHTFFNILNVLIQIPFAALVVRLSKYLIPGDVKEDYEIGYLDSRIIEVPSLAVVQTKKEVAKMGKLVLNSLRKSKTAFFFLDRKLIYKVFEKEKQINQYQKYITKYLMKISNIPLTNKQASTVIKLFKTLNDLERVGDHADNIAEYAQYRLDNNIKFSDTALKELNNMFDKVEKSFKLSIESFEEVNTNKAKKVADMEDEIDRTEKYYRANHIERLNKLKCNPSAGIIYLDLVSNLERIADHSTNVSLKVLDTLHDN